MNLLESKRVLDYVSRHLVCRVPQSARRVALTFDDGPNPAATPRLLRTLDAHGVRATFFLLGRHVEKHPALASEIAARGHEVGNHTHTHAWLPLLPRRWVLHELERAAHAIHHATGQRPKLFRPPMGWFNRGILQAVHARGYRAVLGDVYPQDTLRPGSQVIAQRVLERVRPGSIVILHDGVAFGRADRGQSLDAVDLLIGRLRDRGWEICTVGELMAGVAENTETVGAATA